MDVWHCWWLYGCVGWCQTAMAVMKLNVDRALDNDWVREKTFHRVEYPKSLSYATTEIIICNVVWGHLLSHSVPPTHKAQTTAEDDEKPWIK